jgi:cytochrome P450
VAVPASAASLEQLSRDPYPIYRRLRDEGVCVWLHAASRYVVPRWDDVFSLDERPQITAREEPSLMTRAMGRTMLRTDGSERGFMGPARVRRAVRRGPLVCPGAYVARQQVACAALPALLSLPGIRLAGEVPYQGWVFRGRSRLDVTRN